MAAAISSDDVPGDEAIALPVSHGLSDVRQSDAVAEVRRFTAARD